MEGLPLALWLAAPVLAFVLSILFTGAACQLAPALGLVDNPDGGRKRHKRPTPVMGGAAFVLSLTLVIVGAAALRCDWICRPFVARSIGPLLSSAILFCALGVVDDRIALRPRYKLAGQILASLPFVFSIPSYGSVMLLGYQIPLGPAVTPCIVLWLVACSNVINLIDGLDGLAGTVGLISLLTVAALFGLQGRLGSAIVALVAAASIAGFLIYNWPPAKIFMGDGGSLTIGFLVGALSIQASSKTATGLTLAVPMVLISVPIFDTCMAILRRKLSGRSIGEGDRCHIHHRLQDHGLTRKQALLTIGGLSLVMAAAALTSALTGKEWAGLLICGGVLSLLIAGRVFGDSEAMLLVRHVQAVGALLLDTSGALQTRFLLARIGRFDERERLEIWKLVSHRVQQMGGRSLEFRCATPDGRDLDLGLYWTAADVPAEGDGHEWQFAYSVPREEGATATLSARGVSSRTAAGQRLDDLFRLFARVCQEMPLSNDVPDASETLSLPDLPPATATLRRAA